MLEGQTCVVTGSSRGIRRAIAEQLGRHGAEVVGNVLDRIPLNRFATVEDVAGVVHFVAGPDASYTTGQILAVNGGMEW